MTEEATDESAQEKKEDSTPYCPIYTQMGRECKGRTTTWDWDDTEEKETRDTPKLVVVTPVPSPQQPKTYKQPYLDCMLNNPPLWVTTRNCWIQEIIIAQKELNQTMRSIPQQNLIDEVE